MTKSISVCIVMLLSKKTIYPYKISIAKNNHHYNSTLISLTPCKITNFLSKSPFSADRFPKCSRKKAKTEPSSRKEKQENRNGKDHKIVQKYLENTEKFPMSDALGVLFNRRYYGRSYSFLGKETLTQKSISGTRHRIDQVWESRDLRKFVLWYKGVREWFVQPFWYFGDSSADGACGGYCNR